MTKEEAELALRIDANSETLNVPPFPQRVSRALWYYDYAQKTYYADLRWTMIATALEALILWLEADGMSRGAAYLWLGQVLEARCTQFVNPTFTYLAKVHRDYWPALPHV